MNLGNIWSDKTPPPNYKRKSENVKKFNMNKPRKISDNHSKAYWGTPTWFLFHTIAARINEQWYNQNYTIVWNFIRDCCAVLPCPFCRTHAVAFVNSINISSISTKNGLKNTLYNFHNVANSHSGKGNVNRAVLTKYDRAKIKSIFDLFESRFFRSYIGTRQFNDWQKNEFKIKFYDFFNTVRTHFN